MCLIYQFFLYICNMYVKYGLKMYGLKMKEKTWRELLNDCLIIMFVFGTFGIALKFTTFFDRCGREEMVGTGGVWSRDLYILTNDSRSGRGGGEQQRGSKSQNCNCSRSPGGCESLIELPGLDRVRVAQ